MLLQPRKLPARFNVIPFLTVMDPESDMKATVSRPLLYSCSPKLIHALQASSYIANAKVRMPPGIYSIRQMNIEWDIDYQ